MKSNRARSAGMLVGLTLLALLSASSASAAPLIPDIQTRPLPTDPSDVYIQGNLFRFSNGWANYGQGPWEVVPAGPAENEDCDGNGDPLNDLAVNQSIYQDTNGNGVFERGTDSAIDPHPAGCMIYHPAHNHFHINDAGVYALVSEATGGLASRSSKTSFCLLDIFHFDPGRPGSPSNSYYNSCNPSIQGISIGWYDEYNASLSGQEISVLGVGAGNYCLYSEFDRVNRFVELSDANNAAERRYFLDPAQGDVTPLSGACNLPVPETTITGGFADGSVTNDNTPSLEFATTQAGSVFECSIDSTPFVECGSPFTPQLSDGSHVVSVRATTIARNDPTPSARTITIDTDSPETKITRGPKGRTHDRTPTFRFKADETATLKCKIDHKPLRSCSSPRHYHRLRLGKHVFKARAIDQAGNKDPEAARRTFRVLD